MVVGLVRGLIKGNFIVEGLFKLYGNPSPVRPDLYAAVKELVTAQQIKGADKLAGVKVQGVIALLELVKLFENGYGNNDVVLLELVDAGAVVKDDVGVEDEYLLFARSQN